MAHRDGSGSRVTCLKSGDKRTLVRSAIEVIDPEFSFNPLVRHLNFDAQALLRLCRLEKKDVA